MEKLTQEDRYKLAAKGSINSLYTFLRNFWDVLNESDDFEDSKHIKYLCDFLEEQFFAYLDGGDYHRDVIVNVPPGTSKSTIFSQMFPVWCWLHAPHLVFIVTSFGAPSIDHSVKRKKIFKSDKFQYFFSDWFKKKHGKKIKLVKDTEALWSNNYGGEFFAGTTNGAITGKHAHILIRDDPMSQQKAMSPAERKRAHNFNDKALPTRKKDKLKTPTYTIMQRLHEDDTTGHELAKKDKVIHHIVLPGESTLGNVKPPELEERLYTDGLLDPNRLSRKALDSQKGDLGSSDYHGQFLQTPFDSENQKIKQSWYRYCERYEVPDGLVWDLWIDGAYTKSKDNDPTGFLLAALHERTNYMYVKDFYDAYLEMPDLLEEVKDTARYNLSDKSKIWVEPKASGLTLIQMIRKETTFRIRKIEGPLVREGKEMRLQVAAKHYESGRIIHVRDSWNEKLEMQLSQFGKVSHDEGVDLMGYACAKYYPSKKSGGRRSNL